YCESRLCFVLIPNRTSSAFIVFGLICPWNLASMACAGLPGISRGSRKLRVSAIHSVRTKKPRRRSAYLKLVGSGAQGRGGIRVAGAGGASGRVRGAGSWPGKPVARGAWFLRRRVRHPLLVAGVGVRRRRGERVPRGGPSANRAGVVLVPVHRLDHRDDRHLV